MTVGNNVKLAATRSPFSEWLKIRRLKLYKEVGRFDGKGGRGGLEVKDNEAQVVSHGGSPARRRVRPPSQTLHLINPDDKQLANIAL
ncbi:hypothetical protein J6590_100627 [Homalodisca vitripennis]|nr:hypothetical protein J6590_035722 [Homalodisca vitripennis]KAG8333920.1 hypothetical protein J6590_100627 [Homalodisca vitripennis]